MIKGVLLLLSEQISLIASTIVNSINTIIIYEIRLSVREKCICSLKRESVVLMQDILEQCN